MSEGALAFKKFLLFGGVVGLFLVGGVVFLLFLRRRMGKGGDDDSTPSALVMAKVMANVLKGQPTHQALAKLVFEALRFGNFSTYRNAFVTLKELQSLFSPLEAERIHKILQDEAQLRRAFETMRLQLKEPRQAQFAGVEVPSSRQDQGEPSHPVANHLGSAVLLVGPATPPERIPMGAMVKGPFGWKLLLPHG